jgi:S1-C subfamily serine protease
VVDRGDPADEAGVEEDDIILAIHGKAFDERRDLATSIHEYRPGDEAVLTILRRDEETEIMELEVTLGRVRIEEGTGGCASGSPM